MVRAPDLVESSLQNIGSNVKVAGQKKSSAEAELFQFYR
jgi:hypothetical protein